MTEKKAEVTIICPITGAEETVHIYRVLDKALSNGCNGMHGDARCDHCADRYVAEYTEHWPEPCLFNDVPES